MIKSMTGYGIGAKENQQVKYTVEIKSLNSKYLELSIRLPKAFSDRELFLRGECTKLIERGKVGVTINVEYTDQTAAAAIINAELLKSYYQQLKDIAVTLGHEPPNIFELALNMPEVISQDEGRADEEETVLLLSAFREAIGQLDQFRKDEGEVLREDLFSRTSGILRLLDDVEAMETSRI